MIRGYVLGEYALALALLQHNSDGFDNRRDRSADRLSQRGCQVLAVIAVFVANQGSSVFDVPKMLEKTRNQRAHLDAGGNYRLG